MITSMSNTGNKWIIDVGINNTDNIIAQNASPNREWDRYQQCQRRMGTVRGSGIAYRSVGDEFVAKLTNGNGHQWESSTSLPCLGQNGVIAEPSISGLAQIEPEQASLLGSLNA